MNSILPDGKIDVTQSRGSPKVTQPMNIRARLNILTSVIPNIFVWSKISSGFFLLHLTKTYEIFGHLNTSIQ